jgi:hypothetical protein
MRPAEGTSVLHYRQNGPNKYDTPRVRALCSSPHMTLTAQPEASSLDQYELRGEAWLGPEKWASWSCMFCRFIVLFHE